MLDLAGLRHLDDHSVPLPSRPSCYRQQHEYVVHFSSQFSHFSANRETDYCVAAFGIVFVISTITWIVDGRKNYVGPRIEVEVLAGQAGEHADHPPIPMVEQKA